MGYDHSRFTTALASCAHALAYTQYWFDLQSFEKTTIVKNILYLKNLKFLVSRLSQKFSLFNRFYWRPLNYE